MDVRFFVDSKDKAIDVSLQLLDEKLVSIIPIQNFRTNDREIQRQVIVPRRNYTGDALFIKVEVSDSKEENSAFVRLQLNRMDTSSSGLVIIEQHASRAFGVYITNGEDTLDSFEFNEEPLLAEIVNKHLILVGKQNEGILIYDLINREIDWSLAGGGAFGRDYFTCAAVTETEVMFVRRGFGFQSYGIQSGNISLSIPLQRSEFQKGITANDHSIYLLESHNPGQDRVHAYFRSTGGFSFDAIFNGISSQIMARNSNPADDKLYLIKSGTSVDSLYSYEAAFFSFEEIISNDSPLLYSPRWNRFYFKDDGKLKAKAPGAAGQTLRAGVNQVYVSPGQGQIFVVGDDLSYELSELNATLLTPLRTGKLTKQAYRVLAY